VLSGRRYRRELVAEQVRQCQGFGDICRAVGNAVGNAAIDQRSANRRPGVWMNRRPRNSLKPSAKLVASSQELKRRGREPDAVVIAVGQEVQAPRR
jgi:hypothetical protein